MADISSVMPITLTNIVVNFGCLATNHNVINHMKCKIMYSEVFVYEFSLSYFLYSVVRVTFIPVISDCYKKTRCHSIVLYKAILYLLYLHSSTIVY